MNPTALVIAVLAVWRVTHLLWGEDGPFDLFVHLRVLAGSNFLGKLLDCFYCLSLWIAAPAAWMLENTWLNRVLVWLALSGGAILLERATSGRAPPASWVETPPGKESLESCPVVESSAPPFASQH